ncbi:MAG: helix-turn-helix domain-containing protein [Dehalococcoidia bacterium]|nr:helix-turn-helix domain-containing protein [Dehalococcoidia bacterium]
MTASESASRSSLLGISRASKLLGVSEITLRQWTDEGQIKVFLTPGGHRRYQEDELRRFMGTRQRRHGIRDVVARMEMAPAQDIQIARDHFADAPWYNKLDLESRDKLRELGKRIHGVVITYITKPTKRDETLQMARQIGSEFGALLAELEISLSDSLEAFLLHRSPLVNAAADLLKKKKALNERAAEAIPLVNWITDEALLALVTAHQNYHQEVAESK